MQRARPGLVPDKWAAQPAISGQLRSGPSGHIAAELTGRSAAAVNPAGGVLPRLPALAGKAAAITALIALAGDFAQKSATFQ